MIKNKEINHLEHSRVKLSITVEKEALGKEYRDLLSDYAKKAHIDGFRRGKVPPAVLERKFGDEIKAEATQNIIEKSLKSVFDEIEEKPLTYEPPELENGSAFSLDEDFSFTVAYDIFPKVEMGPYTGLTIEEPVVKITEDDENREIEALVEQNSFVVEKDDAAVKGDTATVTYWETDESGAEIPGTKCENFVLTAGEGDNGYDIEDAVIGMKKGEKKEVAKTFSPEHEDKDLAGKTKKIAVELTALREKKRPEVNDELAQDISDSYETLEDMKKDIRKRLEESAKFRTRNLTIDALMDQVVGESVIDLPESMMQAELDRLWHQFVSRFRMKEEQVERLLQLRTSSKDALFAEWRPNAERSLKIQILIEKMIENEKIEATDAELEDTIRERAENARMDFEEMKNFYEKANLTEMVRHDIQEKKLFDLILGKNTLTAGKEISFIDTMGGNQ